MARIDAQTVQRASHPKEDTARSPKTSTRRRKMALAAIVAALALAVASTVTGAATRAYSIVYGDTLNEIASKHGTDVATLVGLNDLGDPDMIIAGDEINVPDGDLTTYTIQEGDTLAGIAASYGVDIQELIAVNKIDDPDLIRPGNVLMIYLPVEGSESPAADEAVDSDDEATEPANAESDEASDESTDVQDEGAGDSATDEAGAEDDESATTSDESQAGRLHLVQAGETLALIAAEYDVTEAQIIAANALESAEVSSGMILKIPLASSAGVELIGMPTRHEQWPLMSELSAASLATAYWGAPVSAEDLLAGIERSDNPHLGFRGDPYGMFGTTEDYGVYNAPLAAALEAHGFSADAFYADGDRSALTSRIDAGKPVVVWVTYNLTMQERNIVEDDLGRYSLIREQHAVLVYGYDDAGISVMDVGTGASATWDWDTFMASWSLFDGMGLAIDLQ
ncbi:MAG: LysM peptidoglycan-binding domain-containing protein [Thermomicrobiales bacterium]